MSSLANDNTVKGVNDDQIQPFQLNETDFRGRIVRLNGVLNDILGSHDYPVPVAQLLAEGLALTSLLANMLKFEGIFTLQASGEGPVKALVCDMTSEGEIRGYASYDEEAMMRVDHNDSLSLETLMGKGYLAFTVDQKMVDRYQGIVELKDVSLLQSVQHYFEQSEQIKTVMKVAVEKNEKEGASTEWKAGAVMLQKLPEETKIQLVDKDDWTRSRVLLESCTDKELFDRDLPLNDLLYRLFHEEGVVVFPPQDLKHVCRCSEERVLNVIKTLSDEDLDYSTTTSGEIEMKCEFCSRLYVFKRDELNQDEPDLIH
jgi:molecular chaperone Hsp33